MKVCIIITEKKTNKPGLWINSAQNNQYLSSLQTSTKQGMRSKTESSKAQQGNTLVYNGIITKITKGKAIQNFATAR